MPPEVFYGIVSVAAEFRQVDQLQLWMACQPNSQSSTLVNQGMVKDQQNRAFGVVLTLVFQEGDHFNRSLAREVSVEDFAREDLQRAKDRPLLITQTFRKVCRKLEIEDFRFHDLRHTAASWLRMSGADTHTVAQPLGHKDLRMAARYQHLSPGFLAEALGRLDGVFGEYRYPDVTNEKALTSGEPISALDS